MWDLPRLVQIQRARHALRDGRLDEAYAIVVSPRLRDHRQCQVLQEKLVKPLLKRAAAHLEGGRFEDALADVERARELGGNRPATAKLREEALANLERQREERDRKRQLRRSVERHIEAGRPDEGAARLARDVALKEECEDLDQRLEGLRRRASEARTRATTLLERGEIEAALKTLGEVNDLAGHEPESRELLLEIGRQGEAAVGDLLRRGAVDQARSLYREIERAAAFGANGRALAEALDLCDKSAAAIRRGDWPGGHVYLRRLLEVLPGASWVETAATRIAAVEDAVRDLRAGPLGKHISSPPPKQPVLDDAPTLAVPSLAAAGSPPAPGAAAEELGQERFILWVDGVGSFLLLTGERATVGRAGSSTRPDIALQADIEGIHAEILRLDHDYFLDPRGAVTVGGQAVERHLLAHGDRIRLGEHCRLRFLMPTHLSPTAILELGSGLRLEGDVRKVILLDGHLVFGNDDRCHIRTPDVPGRTVLSMSSTGFKCRSPQPLRIDGEACGTEAAIPPGAHVEAGPLTFTLTRARRDGRLA